MNSQRRAAKVERHPSSIGILLASAVSFSLFIIAYAAKQRQACRNFVHARRCILICLIPSLPSPYIASIDANPARLSPVLASLFPPGAIAAELREPGDPSLLLPAEAQYLSKAVLKRVQEFSAGRLCARALLAQFGILDFAIEVGEARQPVWPNALVGSITHTAGFCAAVVAEKSRFAAIGMDCEVAGSVKPELWPSICTPEEILWLNSLPETSRVDAATLIFSAKEAFYKCQYPLTGERLTFHDARVDAPDWGAAGGTYTILATKRIALADTAALPLRGRYLFHQQFVTAGLSWPQPRSRAVIF